MQHRIHGRRTPIWLGVSVLCLGVGAWASPLGPLAASGDDEGAPPAPFERTAQPVTAVDPSANGETRPFDPADEHPGRDGGPVEILEARLDPSVPLPIPAVVEEGPNGDVLVAPASGDPFFLSFIPGNYYPPTTERIDPQLIDSVRLEYLDGRPRTETFGFLMLNTRITEELKGELEGLGARLMGFHPHNCLKAALPIDAIGEIAAHPAVRWVGQARDWQKVHPGLTAILQDADPNRVIDIYVSLFDTDLNPASVEEPLSSMALLDQGVVLPVPEAAQNLPKRTISNGWQQRALEGVGVQVDEYVDRIRAFRARVLPAGVEHLVSLDFVQFIDPDLPAQPGHDESTPMVHTDRSRASYNGGTNQVAVVGEADSGIHHGHYDINHTQGVGWDFTGSTGGSWSDGCTHGTHVIGTVLGNGDVIEGHTGNAPGLGYSTTGRVFNAKIFDDTCGWGGASVSSILSVFESDYTSGGNTTPKPHVINHSWGTSGGTVWTGTEPDCRTFDQSSYDNRQLHVVCAGNSGSGGSTIWEEGSSKNVLTVANVVDYDSPTVGDPGNLWSSSSRGPCGDNRWKPNIAAPGRLITSALSGTTSSYTEKSGTSMATPHVVGLAAQNVDHYSWMAYQPARVASLIMASAMTKDNVTLSSPSTSSTHHLNMYGAGRIEAYKAHYGFTDWTWSNWGFDLSSGSWTYADFTVPTGATRLVVVCTYYEPAASAGAGQALVNDFDLWLDQDPIDPAGNTGEWFAQQSTRDNTEIRIINSPQTGPWRWKLYPDSTSSTVHASVTVGYITGDTTPDATMSVTASDSYVAPNADVDITCSVIPDDYVASAVFADSTSSGDALQASTTTLYDGVVTDLMDNEQNGRDVVLGDIRNGSSRSVTWTTRWSTEGVKTWSVNARSDNMVDKNGSVQVTVDGTPPTLPTNMSSSSHPLGGWSNNPTITWTWTASQDPLSGLAGYGEYVSSGAPISPTTVLDIGAVTTFQATVSTSPNGYYLNLRPVDNVGNWNASYANTGPYYVDTIAPGGATGLGSPTHTVGVQSCDTTVTVTWTAASDSHSGLAGYDTVWDYSAGTVPSGSLDTGAGTTSKTVTRPSSNSGQYFHIRSKDNAGNWGPTAHIGPFYVHANPVVSYCTAKVNSQGCQAGIYHTGTPDVGGLNNLRIRCSNVINQKPGLLFWGSTGSAAIPFQGGLLCVNPPTKRTPPQSSGGSTGAPDCSGTYAFHWSDPYMATWGINPGDTRWMQYWYRDPAGSYGTALSDGLQVTFCE